MKKTTITKGTKIRSKLTGDILEIANIMIDTIKVLNYNTFEKEDKQVTSYEAKWINENNDLSKGSLLLVNLNDYEIIA